MRRGISGGQKKRLTTGELIVGPTRALFMDEISNGLDSSTTFQIVSFLKHLVHITDATALISLLQPAPETFDLFDDIILMAEGKIVYHGPRTDIRKFFEDCGFKCPERKGVADFLQEVGLKGSYLSHFRCIKENCFANLYYSRLSLGKIKHSTGTVKINHTVIFLWRSSSPSLNHVILAGS